MIGTCDRCGETKCGHCCIGECIICSHWFLLSYILLLYLCVYRFVFEVRWCDECELKLCGACVAYNVCQEKSCYTSNCDDCDHYEDSVKYCLRCENSYCAEHLMMEHIKGRTDEFCSDCNERATTKLNECNSEFDVWVKDMEEKYCGGGAKNQAVFKSVDFSGAMKERERLRLRCHHVGNKLPMKQKQFERYDHWVNRYDLSHSKE